jgi:hypothetical protein
MKCLIVGLTVAAFLSVSGSPLAAPPAQDLRTADSKTPAEAVAAPSQDLRSADSRTAADRVAPASQDLRSADSRTPAQRTSSPTVVTVDLPVPDDGATSPWLILLLGAGAGLALAAMVATTQHIRHAQHPVA